MIVQAKAAFDLFESIGPAAALADCGQRLFSQVDIFEVLEMGQNGLTGIVRLGPPGALCQPIQALLDVGR
jgi:hypothetical protein